MRNTLVALAVVALALSGCGRREDAGAGSPGATTKPAVSIESAKTLRIAVIPKATNIEYWKAIHAGAIKAEHELGGIQIVWKGAAKENDREQQIGIVENFVNAHVAGIVMAPLDETALLKPVKEAAQAGIPVVIMDSGLKGEAGKDFAAYVATDNFAGGRKAARRMGELLGGKGKVIVLRYQVGSASTTQREDGFLAGLKDEFPGIEVLSADQYGGPTTETGLAKAENLLSRFPQADGVFCACEPIAWGMVLALRNAGLARKVKVVGFDTSTSLVDAMRGGEVHGLVLQDPLQIGYLAVKTLVAHIRGEKVPLRIDTGSEVATPENMNEPRIQELLRPPIEKYLQ